MMKSNVNRVRLHCLGIVILLRALLLMIPSPNRCGELWAETGSNMKSGAKEQVKATALEAVTRTVTAGFAPSLEMKENTDFLLTPALLVQTSLPDDSVSMDQQSQAARFDAIIELNAPLCGMHVVLFARHWVSTDVYRAAVVWAEPHASAINFPIYPPTLNVASDPNEFAINHQLVHTYDGVHSKPVGLRGPFRHRFNSYSLSDIRFAEQETLNLLNGVEDKRENNTKSKQSRTRHIVLPERPITVGFSGRGPTITVNGESREYAELETIDREGGRHYTVDYETLKIAGQEASMPVRTVVCSGDDTRVLQSARLYNFALCEMSNADRIEAEAHRFGDFDPYDVSCRDLLLKYWMKPSSDVSPSDANSLRGLCTHSQNMSVADATVGEQLKRVNALLQLHWMLDDTDPLEKDFREYISLLAANGLGRMILFGGQNVIETTIRWAQFRAADRLLPLWLDAALSRNDPNSLLDFASANLARKRFWTTAKLMEKVLANPTMSVDQRFAAGAYQALALSGIHQMASDPDHRIDRELDIAQVRWVLMGEDEERLLAQLKSTLAAAERAYAGVAEPSREHRSLKKRLDTIMKQAIGANRSQENETTDLQGN